MAGDGESFTGPVSLLHRATPRCRARLAEFDAFIAGVTRMQRLVLPTYTLTVCSLLLLLALLRYLISTTV